MFYTPAKRLKSWCIWLQAATLVHSPPQAWYARCTFIGQQPQTTHTGEKNEIRCHDSPANIDAASVI
jgi:hypothetical protein